MNQLAWSAAAFAFLATTALAADGDSKPKPPPPPPHANGPEAAAADMKKLTAASGVEATLFASEPMVVNPADMDVDERGRVWICEGANYRLTMHKDWGTPRAGGDRILILEDTDRDGKADKETVFYQDPTVNTALGICVLGNKVIISSSPWVFVLTDTDGDSKADKRELLFEDNTKGDHDHCTHAFVFGPDGKFYFNFGNEVKELRRPKGGLLSLPLNGPVPQHDSETVVDLAGNPIKTNGKPYRQGMALRCNPDGSQVESLGWNFRNNYELAVDSFGTIWQSDNDDDGNRGVRINYVMEFGNYGFTDEMTGAGWSQAWKKAQSSGAPEEQRPPYHWYQQDPGVVPNLLHTGNGSPTGIAIYEGNLLPAVFRNQMLHCDAGPRVVRAYPVKDSGAGYTATIENLLSSSDSWYRPSDVCVGPDGSVYVCDWSDAGVGGHNMADRKLETMTGRVYRLAPPGHKPDAPKLNLDTPAGAVAALRSPNHAARYLAWTALRGMGSKAEGELLNLYEDDNPRMRARALPLLARLENTGLPFLQGALRDVDPNIRIAALRTARQLKMDITPVLEGFVRDSSAQVRRECAIALRHNTSPETPKIWAALATQHTVGDRWYLEALGIAADRNENACFDAWFNAVGGQWNTSIGREIVWRSRASKVPGLIVKIVTDKNTSAADKARFMRALDFIKGPEREAALAEIATAALN